MKNKNIKTNKKNNTLIMPKKEYYTIQGDLFGLNRHFNAEITIRVRHTTTMIETGKVAVIGVVPGGKGRPQNVYAFTPVTQAVLDKAKVNGITLVEGVQKLVNVINVTSIPHPTTPAITSLSGEKLTVV